MTDFRQRSGVSALTAAVTVRDSHPIPLSIPVSAVKAEPGPQKLPDSLVCSALLSRFGQWPSLPVAFLLFAAYGLFPAFMPALCRPPKKARKKADASTSAFASIPENTKQAHARRFSWHLSEQAPSPEEDGAPSRSSD